MADRVAGPASSGFETSAEAPAPTFDFGPPVPGGGVVDLSLGRVTHHRRVFRVRLVAPGEKPGDWSEFAPEAWTMRVSGEVERNGLRYAVEEQSVDGSTGDPFETWMRQDRSGLFVYQADLDAQNALEDAGSVRSVFLAHVTAWLDAQAFAPERRDAIEAAAARIALKRDAMSRTFGAAGNLPVALAGPPGGPAAAEITFLRYPLHPGARWEGRVGFNVWTVEALEWLPTPVGRFPAARMRIELPELFGPNDAYRTWWSRPGEVRRRAHFESEATSPEGEPLGILQSEEENDLDGYVPGPAVP